MIDVLRNGAWLTRERLRVYPLMLLIGLSLAVLFLGATSNGQMDRFDRPLGTDFSQVWTAGVEVLEGQPQVPYDNRVHAQKQRDLFGDKTQFYGWHYPPYFLGLAAVLALMPYLVALLAWQAATLALYLASVRAIIAGRIAPARAWLIPALAFPAVFVNLGHGHNGFLTAALLACALLCLDKRPWLAGLLIGLLAYKPQFALIVPVALVAGGHWRTLVSAAATVAAMTLATLALWGPAVWQGFFASLAFTRDVVLEQGSTGFEKIQTVFAGLRLIGASVAMAYAGQAVATLLVVLAVAWLWHQRADFRLRAAALMVATMLTTPYALDYDMMVLGPALAFMVMHGLERGFAPFEKTLLALVWVVPLLARCLGMATHVPVGVLVMAGVFVVVMGRWVQGDGAPQGLAVNA